MVLHIPALLTPLFGPVVRLQPLRWLRRRWIWWTAPKASRVTVWNARNMTPLRDRDDRQILNELRRLFLNYGEDDLRRALMVEARRRGLPDDGSNPLWLQAVNAATDPEQARIARILFQP